MDTIQQLVILTLTAVPRIKRIAPMPVVVALCLPLVAGCGLADRPVGDGTVVARATGHKVTVRELATSMAAGRYLPLRPEIAERWAWLWVEYTLFAQRVLEGDSLVDSATVLQSRWPRFRARMVDSLFERLAQEQSLGGMRAVDSAFAAGDQRYVQYMLVHTAPALSERDRSARRRRAEGLRTRLVSGDAWTAVTESNEDESAQIVGGDVVVVSRGMVSRELEDAAFALEPGEISPVTETALGYHVIRRPPLEEIRAAYARVIQDTLYWRMRDAYADELLARYDVRLAPDAPDVMRTAAESPNRNKQSRDKVGTYRGGQLTAAGFVRWLQVLPIGVHEGISQSGDGELRELARRIIRYDLEWTEAKNAGILLPDSVFRAAKWQVARDVSRVRRALAIDSVRTETAGGRGAVASDAALGYLTLLAQGMQDHEVANVPPFLADKLREEARWSIRYDTLDEVLDLARILRAADSTSSGRLP